MITSRLITRVYVGEYRDLINHAGYYGDGDIDTYEEINSLIEWLNNARSNGATHVEIYSSESSEDITAQAARFVTETDEEFAERERKENEKVLNDKKQKESAEYKQYLKLRVKYEK